VATDRSWRWIAWLILGIGLLILIGGLALGWASLRHVLYGERADGEVVEIRRDGDMYAPVVRFRLRDGAMREVADLASGAPDFARGDNVTILYMSGDPEDFRIDTFRRLWESAIYVTVFAGFWLMFGAVAWGLSRGMDLFVLGERAFATIAAGAALVGVAALWTTIAFTAAARAPRARWWRSARRAGSSRKRRRDRTAARFGAMSSASPIRLSCASTRQGAARSSSMARAAAARPS